jgi:hypothetical protein
MNIQVIVNGADVTDSCLLKDTKIVYDSSKRITTANLTIMGETLGKGSRYDYAHYGQDVYSVDLQELYLVTIRDAGTGAKLFEGQIYAMQMEQSDGATFPLFYKCQLNDYASYLDRAVCWGGITLTMPMSDKSIIQTLLAQFCPQIDATQDVQSIVPSIQSFDWKTKSCRAVLDDMKVLSGAEWSVDFNAVLHYHPASAAPVAPYALSTSHDDVTSFAVRVSNYKHDFNNPVNTAYVRGSVDPSTGTAIEANYQDPVSVQKYGVHSYAVVDTQITTAWDASLRAKSIVLQYAYPVETGNFTVWGYDWLKAGQQVQITEDAIGISGQYLIRQLSMTWLDQSTVQYEAQFGAAQPDLEVILRQLIQRAAWTTAIGSNSAAIPAPGSVTDASIAPPGLTSGSIKSVSASSISGAIQANQIGTVNATTIMGTITAGQIGSVNASSILGSINSSQIGSVNASAIVGAITAGQIGSVNATTISGVITAGQIGSVNATTIQGVVLSSQLADGIIDDLAKYVDALRPVPMLSSPPSLPSDNNPPNSFFYYIPDGHFYQITAGGLSYVQNDNPQGSLMNFYHIGAISAGNIIGLIVAAQIQSITAGQITGMIQAAQIQTVNASSISGTITASQIGTVNASVIQGQITGAQIANINASQITGTISASQIASVNASSISGTITATQIGSVSASTITIGQLVDSQIAGMSGAKLLVGSVGSDKFNGYSIDVGGLNNMPGRIRVFDGGGTVVAAVGNLDIAGGSNYGGWFKKFGAGASSYATAPIYTDDAGNLFIRNPTMSNASLPGASLTDPNLNISNQIKTSPQTFDATYNSLALQNSTGGDVASFISRGLVIYANNTTKVGALVRDPSGAFCSLEFPTGGYVLITSASGGFVRSDGGYKVGSFTGVTGSFTTTDGKTVSVNKGIVTSIA